MRKKSAVLCLLLPLVACADTPWPASITGEAPPEVLNAPRVVSQPDRTTAQEFPNLASVPAKPTGYSTEAERQREIEALLAARKAAEAVRQRQGATR